jgi:anti-sigma B factor antagonist
METAIGVFGSRERAEEALKELLSHNIPQESIVFLTRSETEAVNLAKDIGSYAGGFLGGAAGLTASAAAAALLIPGLGTAFALGIGATALLGLAGARGGAAMGKAVSKDQAPESIPDNEDAAMFRRLLKEGRSLIIVRTQWHEVAASASGILDRFGIAMEPQTTSTKLRSSAREVNGVAILDLAGRMTIGDNNMLFRTSTQELVDKGARKVLLNLKEVDFVDSAGLGELVKAHTSLRKHGGQLKMTNLNDKVEKLFKLASLTQVFEIYGDEGSAIRSFASAARA